MAHIRIEAGAEFDVVSPGELDKSLAREAARARAAELEMLAGIKYRRIPQLTGTAAAGVLDIGGDSQPGWSGKPVGPAQGYAWEIKLISVNGLTAGATPDVVNLFILGAGSNLAWWQFNGNNFSYTFGKAELVLLPGETLRIASQGTFAATGPVTLIGSAMQVPAEMLAKLVR